MFLLLSQSFWHKWNTLSQLSRTCWNLTGLIIIWIKLFARYCHLGTRKTRKGQCIVYRNIILLQQIICIWWNEYRLICFWCKKEQNVGVVWLTSWQKLKSTVSMLNVLMKKKKIWAMDVIFLGVWWLILWNILRFVYLCFFFFFFEGVKGYTCSQKWHGQ